MCENQLNNRRNVSITDTGALMFRKHGLPPRHNIVYWVPFGAVQCTWKQSYLWLRWRAVTSSILRKYISNHSRNQVSQLCNPVSCWNSLVFNIHILLVASLSFGNMEKPGKERQPL